ncbi:MAG: response regulator, partial [Methanosarcinales archaeon]|nr:response regulator [Methanosarcinales archaeon]
MVCVREVFLFGMIWIVTMRSKKIVVIEDELVVGMMIKLKLEKMGYSVTGIASKG